ncbi:hypothetical protein ES708_17512 [subsurface metagenome]
MVKIEWHPKALEDLRAIFDYINRDSPYYAKIIIEKIHLNVHKLKKFPQLGRQVPEFNKNEFRELIIQNYRVVYHNQTNNFYK